MGAFGEDNDDDLDVVVTDVVAVLGGGKGVIVEIDAIDMMLLVLMERGE